MDNSEVRQLIDEANAAFDFGDFKLTWRLYNEAYRKCPTSGHIVFRLGVIYESGLKTSEGETIVPSDKTLSASYFSQAILELTKLENDPEALCDLGYLSECGYGVPKNTGEAVSYYKRAADLGYARAICNLAYMYEHGEGCERDPQKALQLYLVAANKGLARGQCNLGFMYNSENSGIEKNPKLSEFYYKQAASQGYSKAQFNLAMMYYNQQQKLSCIPYFLSAYEKGHAIAKRYLNQFFSGSHQEEELYIAKQYLMLEWPRSHHLLHSKCRVVTIECALCLRNTTSLYREVIREIVKTIIFYWKERHFGLDG